MYDNIRDPKYNFKDCRQVACSEIRAANLGGYCKNAFTYFNSFTNQKKNKILSEDCVKDVAVMNLEKHYRHCYGTYYLHR